MLLCKRLLYMKYTYKATKEDIEAIEEGINIVFDPKLSFIFKDKSALEKFLLVSYDSEYIFCWSTEKIQNQLIHNTHIPNKKNVSFYKLPHKLYISEQDRIGWHASIILTGLYDVFPKTLLDDVTLPKMSGSLLGDFIITQKETKGEKNNPYVTKESFLATLIHEFGHAYYNQVSPSVKTRSLKFLHHAEQLFLGKTPKDLIAPYVPYIPSSDLFYVFGEAYAICAELYASNLLFPKHHSYLSSFILKEIQKVLQEEYSSKDPFLDLNKNYHTVAAAIGKIFMHLYPSYWPEVIIQYPYFFPDGKNANNTHALKD